MHTDGLGESPVRKYRDLCTIWVVNDSSDSYGTLPGGLDGRLVPPETVHTVTAAFSHHTTAAATRAGHVQQQLRQQL